MSESANKLTGMLFDNMNLMGKFNKENYSKTFNDLYEKYKPFLEELEKEYESSDDKDGYIKRVAEEFVSNVKSEEDKIQKKSDKEHFNIDHNSVLTVYILPLFLERRSAGGKALAEEIVKQWNLVFDKYNISLGTFAEIDGGFKRKLCYITTAVCQSLGKSDDCYELSLLRDYRDNYLLSNEKGQQIVRTYYNIAPTIVNRINDTENSEKIYKGIYDKYIDKCIMLIEEDKLNECESLYSEMVYSLKDEFM
ncbi:MAG: hypothetical protein K6E98_07755 [Lachnospiraceae bacterium]|nr:hypothetical protein [Lachnospiraceae bacterium]